jgi:chorismate mutase/prephenate dehydratase
MASDLRIVQVVELTLDLVIASRSGNRAEVEHVHATPSDMARCRRVVDELLPRASRVDARSPMAACQLAREDGASAAIALEAVASDAGLAVVRRGAVDSAAERMRLAIVGTRPSGRTGKEISSFAFTVREEPGALLDVLNVFAERGIPLTNLHSHPAKTDAWSYVFFGEAVGHFTDRPLVMAFEEVKRVTRTFKLLGSYPAP